MYYLLISFLSRVCVVHILEKQRENFQRRDKASLKKILGQFKSIFEKVLWVGLASTFFFLFFKDVF